MCVRGRRGVGGGRPTGFVNPFHVPCRMPRSVKFHKTEVTVLIFWTSSFASHTDAHACTHVDMLLAGVDVLLQAGHHIWARCQTRGQHRHPAAWHVDLLHGRRGGRLEGRGVSHCRAADTHAGICLACIGAVPVHNMQHSACVQAQCLRSLSCA